MKSENDKFIFYYNNIIFFYSNLRKRNHLPILMNQNLAQALF